MISSILYILIGVFVAFLSLREETSGFQIITLGDLLVSFMMAFFWPIVVFCYLLNNDVIIFKKK